MGRHDTPLRHIILIPRQPVFARDWILVGSLFAVPCSLHVKDLVYVHCNHYKMLSFSLLSKTYLNRTKYKSEFCISYKPNFKLSPNVGNLC